MESPMNYIDELNSTYRKCREDLKELLTEMGGYQWQPNHILRLRVSSLLGTPIITKIKVCEEGRVVFKYANWGDNRPINETQDWFVVPDSELINIYMELWSAWADSKLQTWRS